MNRLRIAFPYLVLALITVAVAVSNVPRGRPADTENARPLSRGLQPARFLPARAPGFDAPQGAPRERVLPSALPNTPPICPPCGMEVDPDGAVTALRGDRTFHFCSLGCRDNFLASAPLTEAAPQPQSKDRESLREGQNSNRLIDVVCNMEVNAHWGIRSEFEGRTYYFCARRCKDRFEREPEQFLSAKCIVCQAPLRDRPTQSATYLGKKYRLCSVEHRRLFKADPAEYFMHTMWGIPTWLYYTSIAIVLAVSFVVFDWLGRRRWPQTERKTQAEAEVRRNATQVSSDTERICGEGELVAVGATGGLSAGAHPSVRQVPQMVRPASVGSAVRPAGTIAPTWSSEATPSHRDRFDLLEIRWINAALRSRLFRFVMQAAFVVAFALIIAAGLWGNQNPAQNIAPILTWTIWWGLLPVVILFAGKAWCYVCPWDAVAGWTERLSLWKKQDEGLSLGWAWPRIVRNISIATILFVGLTWIELGFGVTMKPRVTAYLGIAMLLMAVLSALLFERKSFCRYACLVGRVSGLYALFAGIEIRRRRAGTCTNCSTKECVKGSENAYGCPTFLYPGRLQINTYCIQCMECIQACPHDNLAMNLRPLGEDLATAAKPRSDEAYLALLMLAITAFHGLTMTPAWEQFIGVIRDGVGVGRVVSFSLGMTLLMLAPIGVYALLVAISWRVGARGARPV